MLETMQDVVRAMVGSYETSNNRHRWPGKWRREMGGALNISNKSKINLLILKNKIHLVFIYQYPFLHLSISYSEHRVVFHYLAL